MGLVEEGSTKSMVVANPELMWPVPSHWSLEDAVTVPLAYAYVFYCFKLKVGSVFFFRITLFFIIFLKVVLKVFW